MQRKMWRNVALPLFVGEHDFQVMHNIQDLTEEDVASVRAKQRPSSPMILASIGTAKNLEEDRRVISYFANDPRFHLKFIGRGYDALRPFCRESGIENIEIVGDFPSSDTIRHYRNVDVIISMYGNDLTHVKYQLTNTLYFAAQLGLPIVVSPGTFMDETVSKYGLGFVLNVSDPGAKERVLGLYDPEAVAMRTHGAEAFLKQVEHDNDQTVSKIERFLAC